MDRLVTHHKLQQQDNILVTMAEAQAQLESGKSYEAHINSPTLGDNATCEMYVKAPDSSVRVHLIIAFSSELGGIGELREGPTITASGTVVTAFNKDRNSSNTATTIIRSSPTVTASGTQISHFHVGGGFQGRDPGEAGAEQGWILEQGTIYILRYTSIAGSNEAELEVNFHEKE